MPIVMQRYHNQATLLVDTPAHRRAAVAVYAKLEFKDSGIGHTCLRNQLLDWQGTVYALRSQWPWFQLGTLYDNLELKLPHLVQVPCEVDDVVINDQSITVHVKGPLTPRPLSQLLVDHICQPSEERR